MTRSSEGGAGRHLVLVGSGHAQLFVLEGLARGRLGGGVRVTLISPAPRVAYSGMVPGLIGGRYRVEELSFDLPAITRGIGADLRIGCACRVDPVAREIRLEDGGRVPYDVVSFAIGAGVRGGTQEGVREHALLVRPIEQVLAIVPALERAVAAAGGGFVRAVVVGGGAAGLEIALNIRARLRSLGHPTGRVTLVNDHPGLLQDRSPAAARAGAEALARNRVDLDLGSAVLEVSRGTVRLADGKELRADLIVWAAGASAPGLFAESGLATDAAGYLLVDDALRSVSHPGVFGAGDAITLARYPDTPRSGVHAVRQGPLLRDNLAVDLAGGPAARYRRYRPQPRFLALLNTGDGRAILSYGALALTSGWAMRLKDRIDRRFMRRFQRLGR